MEVHVIHGALADLVLDKQGVLGALFLWEMWKEAIGYEVFEGLGAFLTGCGVTPDGGSEEDLEEVVALQRQLVEVLPLFFSERFPILSFFVSFEGFHHQRLQLFRGQKVHVVLLLLLLIHLLDDLTSGE